MDLAHVVKVFDHSRSYPFEIIERITYFSQFELCFET